MISEEKALECLKLAKSYASKYKNFSINFDTYDDYVSSLLLKLLMVLPLYNEERGSFSTFAYTIFFNEVKGIIKNKNTLKRKHDEISLNKMISSTDNNLYLEQIFYEEETNIDKFIEEEEARNIYKKLCPHLSDLYKETKLLKTRQKDLSIKYKMPQANISKRVTTEQRFIEKVLNDKPIKAYTKKRIQLKECLEEIKKDYKETNL